MKTMKKMMSLLLAASMVTSLTCCAQTGKTSDAVTEAAAETASASEAAGDSTLVSDKAYIEETLNLANNTSYTWSYSADSDAWVMSVVSAVAYPELEDQQGMSVCVPGGYITGIDTDGDGAADVTADSWTEAVNGRLVIDDAAEITSSNGQVYTAVTAPVILNTGAAGYGSSNNTQASATYASEGYINVACGNRGKQDTAEDENGDTYYTGDAPSCLADQKAAARFVKYNILLGNLPGSTDYFVSTGGSGGGAHAAIFAATSNNSDFYPYQEAAGAVGVYLNEDGSYSTTVTIDGEEVALSDGAWGCIAYSAITSLYEADMTLAFEYYLNTDYDFNTSFQKQLAAYLSEEYMDYINAQALTVEESAVGFDLDGDGALNSTIDLQIEYDATKYADTNGYGGTYLDLYLAEFTSNLQWYLDNLDYAEGWTWFDADGQALSDEEVAAMTSEDRAAAFLEGRYSAGSSGGMGGAMGGMGGMNRGNMPGGTDIEGDGSGLPDGTSMPDGAGGGLPDGQTLPDGASMPDGADGQTLPDGAGGGMPGSEDAQAGDAGGLSDDAQAADGETAITNENVDTSGDQMVVGTPDAGTTQSAGSGTDAQNYASYEEMLAAYEADIAEIQAGDAYGHNIVSLYNPLNYIGAEDTDDASWVRIVMGAAEGDMSMFSSLNLQLAWLNAGTNCEIEWQWDGGHVPSETLSHSFTLYVDQMYAAYAGGTAVNEPEAQQQTANGTAESASGTDISSWVDSTDLSKVSFSLADAAAYRTAGASKAMPGFDVMDYGQEDYVFGSMTADARHWDEHLLKVLQEHAEDLSELFNAAE